MIYIFLINFSYLKDMKFPNCVFCLKTITVHIRLLTILKTWKLTFCINFVNKIDWCHIINVTYHHNL